MIGDLVHFLGSHFTHEQYLFWSRIQGSLWTLADIVLVFYLIRIANLCRGYLGEPRHVAPYIILAATLPPAAFIPFLTDSLTFFRIELLVTIPHFLLIFWMLLFNARRVLEAVRRRARLGDSSQSKVC